MLEKKLLLLITVDFFVYHDHLTVARKELRRIWRSRSEIMRRAKQATYKSEYSMRGEQ